MKLPKDIVVILVAVFIIVGVGSERARAEWLGESDVQGADQGLPFSAELIAGGTWPAGTDFAGVLSDSEDPIAPFRNQSVHFLGHADGGSDETIGDAFLAYRFRLEFDDPVRIQSISIREWGDHAAGSLLRLLDQDMNEIASIATEAPNQALRTHTLDARDATGRIFFMDGVDFSANTRYVENITIDYIPEPATTSLLLLGALLMTRRR